MAVYNRQWRLQHPGARPAPHVDGAFEHGRTATLGEHGGDGLRHQPRGLVRRLDAGGKIDQPRDNAGLVADFVEMSEFAADIGLRNLTDQSEHRRIHRIGGEQRRARVEEAGLGTTA